MKPGEIKAFAQSASCPSQVLFAFDEVIEEEMDRVRWAVAYVTKAGCERLIQRIVKRVGLDRWDECEKHFICSIDFGLSEPSALKLLASLPLSNVRIAHPSVVSSVAFRPLNAYHPKLYLFDTPKTTAYIAGSANLTASALIGNTELVVAGVSAPRGFGWDEAWERLLDDTEPLTAQFLEEYSSKWVPTPVHAVEPKPGKIPSVVPAANGQLFWQTVLDGKVFPKKYDHFWVEAGSMSSGGAHNQLELPRGANRFFGFNHKNYDQNHATIGIPPLTLKTAVWDDRPLTWHGNNGMERINLPTETDGGFDYRHTVVLFRRRRKGFEIDVLPATDAGANAWRAASQLLKTEFKLGAKSPRTCGLF